MNSHKIIMQYRQQKNMSVFALGRTRQQGSALILAMMVAAWVAIMAVNMACLLYTSDAADE